MSHRRRRKTLEPGSNGHGASADTDRVAAPRDPRPSQRGSVRQARQACARPMPGSETTRSRPGRSSQALRAVRFATAARIRNPATGRGRGAVRSGGDPPTRGRKDAILFLGRSRGGAKPGRLSRVASIRTLRLSAGTTVRRLRIRACFSLHVLHEGGGTIAAAVAGCNALPATKHGPAAGWAGPGPSGRVPNGPRGCTSRAD